MFFALTDEQRDLQTTVRDYLGDRFGPEQVRAVFDAPDSDGVPAELWKACGEQGWLAVLVPEEHDGLGLGLLDAAVIVRAFGAGAIPGPYVSTLLAGEAIRLAGSVEQQAAWLPRIAAGEVRAAVALHAPGEAWDATGVPLAVEGDTLSGVVAGVEYGVGADLVVLAARDRDGVGLYLLESGEFTAEHLPVLDRTTRLATITVEATTSNRLESSSAAVLEDLIRRGAALTANDLAGVARTALRTTVDYDKTRVQFGKPVGSFQAIKHALADLHVAITMAEHGGLYAAFALDTERPDAELAVSVAKAKAGDTGRAATAAMIQYLGGIGYTWEHDAHFFFKRAVREDQAFGDAAHHRELIAELVIDKGAGPDLPDGGQSLGVQPAA